jgi:hypothetical protein
MLGRERHRPAAPVKAAAPTTRPLQQLWRQTLWASAATAALAVAFLSVRSDIGTQRIGAMLSFLSLSGGPAATHPADARPQEARLSETDLALRQLLQTVHGLSEDRDRLTARLGAIEHDVDDVTGTIKQQIDEVRAKEAERTPPWPDGAPTVPMTPADIAAMVKAVAPAAANPAPRAAPAVAALTAEAQAAHALPLPYGADIGSAASIKGLHNQWLTLRAAHPQLLSGLQPVVSLRDNSKSNRIELHLVIGPFANADSAAQLCSLLAASHIGCQPAMFDGPYLALQ